MQRWLQIAAVLSGLTPMIAGADADTRMQKIETSMQRYQGDVPGASLLVIRDGKPVVRRAFGVADLEHGVKATSQTDYRLASMTKQFTAAAILLLRQDGKLSLQDSVRKWLPELPKSDQAITIDDMLRHASGLIDYEDLIPSGTKGQVSDMDVLKMLSKESRLYFPPGTSYRYSNSGYVLLGLIIERASHESLPQFLKARIFDPLRMTHTLMYEHGRGPEVPNRAYGYSMIGGKWAQTDQDTTSATRGDGGIYSNIDDLAKWDAALYDDRLLDDESRSLAFSPHNTVTGETDVDSYGYGWRLHHDQSRGDEIWHSGESIGFRNVILRWPKQHLTVILLSNRDDPQPYETARKIAALFQP
ncbi:MAG TPA: serine hydrolase domain-containing protein [Rhodanobacteraceae bacterium]